MENGRHLTAPATLSVALLLSALWLLLQGVGLGAIPFHSKGEPREAIVVQDIAQRGDWILPRRNATEIVRKPPLFYWLAAALSQAFGRVDEGSVRLASALQSWAACMLLVILCAATGGARVAFFAGVVLLSSFEWLRAATTARVDMTLALGLTASFVGLCMFDLRQRRVWLALAYAGMIWGTLAKGPVAVVIPALFIVARAVWKRGTAWILVAYALAVLLLTSLPSPRSLDLVVHAAFAVALLTQLRDLRRLHPFVGFAVVGCGAGLWYALAAQRGGSDFFMTQIVQENLARFTGGRRSLGGHEHSVAYLVGALFAGCLPWTLFFPAVLRGVAASRSEPARKGETSALLWAAVVFLFFALAESKRSVYLLPMYPAIALLIGSFLAAFTAATRQARASTLALFFCMLGLAGIAASLAIAFAAEWSGVPVVRASLDFVPGVERVKVALAIGELAARAAPLALAFFMATILALASAALCRVAAPTGALLAFVGATATLMVATQQLILPAVAVANTRRDSALRLGAVGRDLSTRPNYDYATVFYRGGIPVYAGERLDDGPPLLLLRRDEWRRFDWRQRILYQPVAGMDLRKQNNQETYLLVERVAPIDLPTEKR